MKLLLIWIGDKSTRLDLHMDESIAVATAYPGTGEASAVTTPRHREASATVVPYLGMRNSLMGKMLRRCRH